MPKGAPTLPSLLLINTSKPYQVSSRHRIEQTQTQRKTMAPKALSKSQPSKKKEEKDQPSSSEEIDEQESEEEKNSSGEEEEDLSEEEEEEDQGNEKLNTPVPPPKILSNSIAQEYGSDSEPESDDSPSAYKLQPIPKTSITTAKRTQQEINNSQCSSKSNKRTKTGEKGSASAVSSTPGGGCITRLFSNGDEIALLNGLVEFKYLKDADMGPFYDNVKGKLQVDFSREQLRNKIKRMKSRFFNALKKGENGLDPVFSKPHEVLVFEISKKIWGDADGNSKGSKNDASNWVHEKPKKEIVKAEKNVKGEKEIVEDEKDGEEGIMWSKYPFVSASFSGMVGKFPSLGMSDTGMNFVKDKLNSIGNVKAKELNEMWKQMLVEETELHYKMLTLMKEQIKLAMDQ